MLATSLLAEYPTAHAFARANPHALAKLRYDGRHLVGDERARAPDVQAADRAGLCQLRCSLERPVGGVSTVSRHGAGRPYGDHVRGLTGRAGCPDSDRAP